MGGVFLPWVSSLLQKCPEAGPGKDTPEQLTFLCPSCEKAGVLCTPYYHQVSGQVKGQRTSEGYTLWERAKRHLTLAGSLMLCGVSNIVGQPKWTLGIWNHLLLEVAASVHPRSFFPETFLLRASSVLLLSLDGNHKLLCPEKPDFGAATTSFVYTVSRP